MTIQDLSELKISRKMIKLLQQEINQLESLVISINPHYSDMPKGQPEHDKMSNCISQIADFRNQLASEIQYMIKKMEAVHCEINKIENDNYRLILSYRYVLEYKWEDIADVMHYSERHIRRLHDEAIRMSCYVMENAI